MKFSELQPFLYREYVKNGYKKMWESKDELLTSLKSDLAELGLITTEITEAMESIRDNNYENLTVELADIIIRVLNFASRKGLDVTGVIIKKNKKNLNRGKQHGRTI